MKKLDVAIKNDDQQRDPSLSWMEKKVEIKKRKIQIDMV